MLLKSHFFTEMQTRPDDIDMNQHVHNTKYLDYVLAARYEQMNRCYKMPMEDFIKEGLGWVSKAAYIEYKRPLRLGEWIIVETWIEEMYKDGVKVFFEIKKRETLKLSAKGWLDYTMINSSTGRATTIPDWIVEKYSI